MAEVIVVTSGKGGTGKTTVSLLLAKAFCRRGKNVLLLELDSGLRGLDLLLKVSDRVVYDLSDVLTGSCKPVKAITVCDVPKGNLHLIAAPQNRHIIPDPGNLKLLIKGLSECYDYLILDTAAGLGRDFDIACSVGTKALIVATADSVSVRDAARAAQELRSLSPRLVINKLSRQNLSAQLPDLDAVIDGVGAQLISVIPEDSAMARQLAAGLQPSASSPAVCEIDDLAGRIMGERIMLNTDRRK